MRSRIIQLIGLWLFGSYMSLLPSCKKKTVASAPKVVSGIDMQNGASENDFFAILVSEDDPTWAFCGGTFIDERIVVTAAHCLRSDQGFISRLKIRPLNGQPKDWKNGPILDVKGVVVHEDYLKKYKMGFDIALIFLDDWKTKNPKISIRPISFNSDLNATTPQTNKQQISGTIVGLGNTSSIGDLYDDVVRTQDVALIPFQECARLPSMKNALEENTICAGNIAKGGVDTCQGDSGGPLLILKDKQLLLTGITSNGNGCAQKGSPGIYTDVARYADWINDKIQHFYLTKSGDQTYNSSILMKIHCGNSLLPMTVLSRKNDQPFALIKHDYYWNSSSAPIPHQSMPALTEAQGTCIIKANAQGEIQFQAHDPSKKDPYHTAVISVKGLPTNQLRTVTADKQTTVRIACDSTQTDDSPTDGTIAFYPFQTASYPGGFDSRFNAEGSLYFHENSYTAVKKLSGQTASNIKWEDVCSWDKMKVQLGTENKPGHPSFYYLRMQSPDIGDTVIEMNRSETHDPYRVQLKFIKNDDTSGEVTLRNLTHDDLFTWKLQCPFPVTLTLPSGVTHGPEGKNRSAATESATSPTSTSTVDPSSASEETGTIFRSPQDEGSAIPSRASLTMKYLIIHRADEGDSDLSNCVVNDMNTQVLVFQKIEGAK